MIFGRVLRERTCKDF